MRGKIQEQLTLKYIARANSRSRERLRFQHEDREQPLQTQSFRLNIATLRAGDTSLRVGTTDVKLRKMLSLSLSQARY